MKIVQKMLDTQNVRNIIACCAKTAPKPRAAVHNPRSCHKPTQLCTTQKPHNQIFSYTTNLLKKEPPLGAFAPHQLRLHCPVIERSRNDRWKQWCYVRLLFSVASTPRFAIGLIYDLEIIKRTRQVSSCDET